MDDLSVFTPADKSSAAYLACVGGMGLVGASVGRFGGLYGLFLGAAAGIGYGLLSCKRLSPVIERKLLSQSDRLTDAELTQVLGVLREQAGVQTRREGLHVIAQVRHAAALNPEALTKPPNAFQTMRVHAQTLVSRMPHA